MSLRRVLSGFIFFFTSLFLGVRIFLIQTYSIEDCYKYDATEHSQSHGTSTSTSYAVYNDFSFNFSDWEVSFDQKIGSQGGAISLEAPSDRSKNVMVSRASDGGYGAESNAFNRYMFTSTDDSNYHSIKFVKQGTTLTVYFDSNNHSFTVDNSFNIARTPKFRLWRSNTAYIKNLKIKEL